MKMIAYLLKSHISLHPFPSTLSLCTSYPWSSSWFAHCCALPIFLFIKNKKHQNQTNISSEFAYFLIKSITIIINNKDTKHTLCLCHTHAYSQATAHSLTRSGHTDSLKQASRTNKQQKWTKCQQIQKEKPKVFDKKNYLQQTCLQQNSKIQ